MLSQTESPSPGIAIKIWWQLELLFSPIQLDTSLPPPPLWPEANNNLRLILMISFAILLEALRHLGEDPPKKMKKKTSGQSLTPFPNQESYQVLNQPPHWWGHQEFPPESVIKETKPNCIVCPQLFNHFFLKMSRKYVSEVNEKYALNQWEPFSYGCIVVISFHFLLQSSEFYWPFGLVFW